MKLIRKDELAELLRDRWKLRCLEMAGVDNWTWYDRVTMKQMNTLMMN